METVVVKRDLLRIDLHVLDIAYMAAVDHAFTPLLQHRRIDIRHHHLSLRPDKRSKTSSQVACP